MQHLSIAYGSLAELETHLEIAERLKYVTCEQLQLIRRHTSDLGRMLNGLRASIAKKLPLTPDP
jgi:four helix bundle protein